MATSRILVVRLGAMGDVIHALPTVATLKRELTSARITWVIDPKWAALLEGNPYVDEVLEFDRRRWASIRSAWRELRQRPFDVAIDLQGLIKSALITTMSGARRSIGFSREQAREWAAALFYSKTVNSPERHIVDRNLSLAQAAGAKRLVRDFPLPMGQPEGELPDTPYVLTCPLAGWASKQWPLENYTAVAQMLRQDGYDLVVNGPPNARESLAGIRGAHVHTSGIAGLIHATRCAAGVIGVDSGPLHLAAALGKPGVAIFGPTDPARNGPYGGSMTVLRDPAATTSYKRHSEIHPSMRAVPPDAVFDALRIRLAFFSSRMQG